MRPYHIRPAETEDIPAIAEVASTAWKYTYRAIFPRECYRTLYLGCLFPRKSDRFH